MAGMGEIRLATDGRIPFSLTLGMGLAIGWHTRTIMMLKTLDPNTAESR